MSGTAQVPAVARASDPVARRFLPVAKVLMAGARLKRSAHTFQRYALPIITRVLITSLRTEGVVIYVAPLLAIRARARYTFCAFRAFS